MALKRSLGRGEFVGSILNLEPMNHDLDHDHIHSRLDIHEHKHDIYPKKWSMQEFHANTIPKYNYAFSISGKGLNPFQI